MNLSDWIYKKISEQSEKNIRFGLALLSSFFVLLLFYLSDQPQENSPSTTEPESSINLTVMIPDGYVLFGFEAENYEQVSPLLAPYSMVKVYSPNDGRLIAQNIKVLRAPKDPSQLSFLVPVNIANFFARFGLEYRIVLQKYTVDEEPKLVLGIKKKQKTSITYGGQKHDNT